MILACDICQTTYHAEPSAIGPDGRQVKCATCGHSWFVHPETGASQARPAATSAHTDYLRTVHERQVKRSRLAATFVWAAAGTIAAVALSSAVIQRDRVVEVWPRLASGYAAIGLPVNRFGVEFQNVERRRELVGTTPVLTVAADVHNTSERDRQAPLVRIGLLDNHGRRIAEFEAEVQPELIRAGETGRFEAVMENPPADSYTLDLRFADRPAQDPKPANLAETGGLR